LILVGLLLGAAQPAMADTYHFSYTYSSTGKTVSGSFDGTDDGTYVTGITNIQASYDGVPLVGPLSIYRYEYGGWQAGDPVVSFNAANNAFILVNCAQFQCGSGVPTPYNYFMFRHSNPNQNVNLYFQGATVNDDFPNATWSLTKDGGGTVPTVKTYDFSYTFGNGKTVSGSFDGTDDGNLVSGYVTNISNIKAVYDGTPLVGPLNAVWYDVGGLPSPGQGPLVSFDYTKNKFAFVNCANFWGSPTGCGTTPYNYFIFRQDNNNQNVNVYSAPSPSINAVDDQPNTSWSLTVHQGGGTTTGLRDNGDGTVYDTELNVTYLTDGNYAKTSGYVAARAAAGATTVSADGRMTYAESQAWAAGLNYRGVTGWRLPRADLSPACLANQNQCLGGELEHLMTHFFTSPFPGVAIYCSSAVRTESGIDTNIVGGYDYCSGTAPVTDVAANLVTVANCTPQTEACWFWTGDLYQNTSLPWIAVYDGRQSTAADSTKIFAWAVHDGDIHTLATDSTPPLIQPAVTGTLGSNGWYRSDVQVAWTVTDAESTVSATTGCDATSVTSDTAGQTFTCSATSSGGTASQSVTVQRDTVPPTASAVATPLPNANGWNHGDVSVQFSGSDATSGIASCTSPALLAADGTNQSAAGTCVDGAGNVSAPVTASGINIDRTPPDVSASRTPAPNGVGWNSSAVSVSFTATDTLSGVDADGCSAPVTVSGDGAGQTASGSCADRAGNAATAIVNDINVDTAAPVASGTRTPPPNEYGWNNTAVTVSFAGTDGISGSGLAGCTPDVVLSANAANQSASGSCTDRAGNVSATATVTGINIDTGLPTISIATPAANATFSQGASVIASYTCAGGLSGIAACVGPVAAGTAIDTATAGTKTFPVTGTDKAGNVRTLTRTYTVLAAADSTPPVITPALSGTLGSNGWYTSSVAVSWQVIDAESAVTSKSGCASVTVNADTKGVTYSCTATSAGGTATQSVTVRKDASAPTAKATATPAANAAGWRKAAVTVAFTGADGVSGVASCSASVLLSTEGAGQSASGTCSNGAGLVSAVATASGINIDLTPPTVAITVPAANSTYALGSTVAANYACSDALSGIATCTGATANGAAISTATKGTKNFTVTGTDAAGNKTTTTLSYKVQ
jgi:hypothetical protein